MPIRRIGGARYWVVENGADVRLPRFAPRNIQVDSDRPLPDLGWVPLSTRKLMVGSAVDDLSRIQDLRHLVELDIFPGRTRTQGLDLSQLKSLEVLASGRGLVDYLTVCASSLRFLQVEGVGSRDEYGHLSQLEVLRVTRLSRNLMVPSGLHELELTHMTWRGGITVPCRPVRLALDSVHGLRDLADLGIDLEAVENLYIENCPELMHATGLSQRAQVRVVNVPNWVG
ncbi:hypothetical protein [Luteococcus sediminum]